MGWLILLGLLVALGFIPVAVHGVYDDKGAKVWLKSGPFQIDLYPRKAKKAKPSNNAAGASKPKTATSRNKHGSFEDFLSGVERVLSILSDLHKKVHVRLLEVKVTLTDEDPCELAIRYGRACSAVGGIMPILERVCLIKERDVEVQCSFTGAKTEIFARMIVFVSIGRLLLILANHGIKLINEHLKMTNQRKGGTKA